MQHFSEQHIHVQPVAPILLQQLLQLHHASKNCANLSFAPCLPNNERISIKMSSLSVFQITPSMKQVN